MHSLKKEVTYFFCASIFFSWYKLSELHQEKSFPLESRPFILEKALGLFHSGYAPCWVYKGTFLVLTRRT